MNIISRGQSRIIIERTLSELHKKHLTLKAKYSNAVIH